MILSNPSMILITDLNFISGNIKENCYKKIDMINTSSPTDFWNHVKKLGPCGNKFIRMEVLTEDGSLITDSNVSEVLSKWKDDFEALLTKKRCLIWKIIFWE